MNTAKVNFARYAILSTNGKPFSARFRKRSTGEAREMEAETFSDTNSERDAKNNMMTVLERTPNGKRYRTIPLDNLEEVVHDTGKRVKFSDL